MHYDKLHIDGVGFIVSGVHSMDEREKEMREKAASLIPTSLSLSLSLSLHLPKLCMFLETKFLFQSKRQYSLFINLRLHIQWSVMCLFC